MIFQAVSITFSERGYLEDLGIAIVECVGCALTRYGYPNDEGLPEHQLYSKGLSECTGICEVINSAWQAELESQMDVSARRIWRDQYYRAYNVPESGKRQFGFRHFIFAFKEGTFECVADELKATITTKSYDEVLSEIQRRILGELS